MANTTDHHGISLDCWTDWSTNRAINSTDNCIPATFHGEHGYFDRSNASLDHACVHHSRHDAAGVELDPAASTSGHDAGVGWRSRVHFGVFCNYHARRTHP